MQVCEGEWYRVNGIGKGRAKRLAQAQTEVDELYRPESMGGLVTRSIREGWSPRFPDNYDEDFRRGKWPRH